MTRDEIIKALSNIKDPDLHKDIVSLGFVKKVEVTDSKIDIEIQLTTPACPVRDEMKSQTVDEIRKLGFNGASERCDDEPGRKPREPNQRTGASRR